MAANQFVQGYPSEWGNKYRVVIDHPGPASYVAYNASTGAGDIINASDLGYGGFDGGGATFASYSFSGTYIVQVMLTKANDVQPGAAGKRVTIQWFTTSAAFGAKSAEVTAAVDLSAEKVRLDFVAI